MMIECRLIKARVTFRFLYRDMTDEPTRPERSAILSRLSASVAATALVLHGGD